MPYVIGGIAIIALCVGGYYVARFMKGKVTLDMTRDTFATGDTIDGRVTLELKRPASGMLKASLIGREEQRRRRTGSQGGTTTEWVEVYRNDVVLEEETEFDGGFTGNYSFQITAPTADEARSVSGSAAAAVSEKTGSTLLGAVAGMAAGAAMGHGRMKWHVEARLDAKGVDLVATRTVKVRLSSPANTAASTV